MAKKIYDINHGDIAVHFLPGILRKTRLLSFLKVLLVPLHVMQPVIDSWRNDTTYKLQHTGQVIYLEKVLNESVDAPGYDPTDHQATKSIYITDGEAPDKVYIFREIEDNPQYMSEVSPIYLSTQAEYDALYSDFIVNVPSSIVFNESQMNALIEYYKLVGKIHKIKIV